MTKEEAFQQYEEELDRLSSAYNAACRKAKATLHEQLKAIRTSLHEELKAIRVISQKTKGK